jgi:hypothetical protein
MNPIFWQCIKLHDQFWLHTSLQDIVLKISHLPGNRTSIIRRPPSFGSSTYFQKFKTCWFWVQTKVFWPIIPGPMGPTFIRTFSSKYKLGLCLVLGDGFKVYFETILSFLDFGVLKMFPLCSQKVLMMCTLCFKSFQWVLKVPNMFPKAKLKNSERKVSQQWSPVSTHMGFYPKYEQPFEHHHNIFVYRQF